MNQQQPPFVSLSTKEPLSTQEKTTATNTRSDQLGVSPLKARPLPKADVAASNAAKVAAYLQQHPNFFIGRERLLAELQLPHPSSGQAVSLLEYQNRYLREQLEVSNERLQHLIAHARNNDKLFERTRQLTLALLGVQDLSTLGELLTTQLARHFTLDACRLLLFAPLEECHLPLVAVSDLEQQAAILALLKQQNARCLSLNPSQQQLLSLQTAWQKESGSAVLVRLHHGRTQGVLVLASQDTHHFQADMGTLFAEYLGELLSRLLPRWISTDDNLWVSL
ncbi:hypothetical protein SAMN05421831_11087 [Allopseudospirillum japonicum]|uniref:DUF484 domain-containing protein n=1 Tax=Allopseudospirillum japonicum TaxID=64971 RepID=A0A1H6TGZ6_9GAMM|nr:DUF484 family protein [Allopseudospirillum japonicum]SEI79308.1 hypothetical protein SAMN05421831_11087 [Allopseudospirillum japonicum]